MIEVAEVNIDFSGLQQRVIEFLWRSSFNTRCSNLSTLSKVSSLTKKVCSTQSHLFSIYVANENSNKRLLYGRYRTCREESLVS